MYHQLLNIGEEGVVAEIEYQIEDDDVPFITKITIGKAVVPVGAFDLRQIEDMAEKLWLGHADVMRGLVDGARIDAWEANRADMEANP